MPAAAPTAAPGEFDLAAVVDDLLKRGESGVYDKVIAAVDRVVLTHVLRHTRGHQTQASDLLGLNRGTLRHKMRTLGLTLDKTLAEESGIRGQESGVRDQESVDPDA
jgi:two-component system nitrogen regulation response regulator GlnG